MQQFNARDKDTYTKEEFYQKFFKDVVIDDEKKTKCSACLKTFSAQNKIFHVYSNHSLEKPFKCELCPMKFFFLSKRISHMGTHHPKEYKCFECKEQFDRAHLYIAHMQKTHGKTITGMKTFTDEEIDIPLDNLRYTKAETSVTALAQRRRHSVDSPSFVRRNSTFDPDPPSEPTRCAGCQASFSSSRALRTHLRNHANGCANAVAVEIENAKEETNDSENTTFECDQCDKVCFTARSLGQHKKFKHEAEEKKLEAAKMAEKMKYDAHCDICDFFSYRRDYVEHHVRKMHKQEFQCPICSKTLSSYVFYMYHLHESHPKAKRSHRPPLKCQKCDKYFAKEENLESHMKRHEQEIERENHCHACGLTYHSAEGYEIHCSNHFHKNIEAFVENVLQKVLPDKVKEEPTEAVTMEISSQNLKDPFENMLQERADGPPPRKRAKSVADELKSTLSINGPNAEDKMDYLKYMTQVDGVYKCGICGKTKQIRKGMLHHLKQHDEVPSYDCHLCPEKFVFKKKYDNHMECHSKDQSFGKEQIDIDEDSRQSDVAKEEDEVDEIKCDICNVSFKLKIMLNRHNLHWHSKENASKGVPMSEQPTATEKETENVPSIKLLRCKNCTEVFIQASELEKHEKEKHASPDMEEAMEVEDDTSENNVVDQPEKTDLFPCDKCKFVFKESKFLENHQKFFCVFGQAKTEKDVNEQ